MDNANNKQVAGDHYQSPIQCWDYLIANVIGYLEGTAIKYLSRWKKKGGIDDLKKAIHFIEKLIEVNTHEKSIYPDEPAPHTDSYQQSCYRLGCLLPVRHP